MSLALHHTVKGPEKGPILFFIHGWPDTESLWDEQVKHFSKQYRCVTVTLPSFEPSDDSQGGDFPVLVDRLVETIKEVRAKSKAELTLVGHDWGAFLTYLLDQKHPEIADRVVTMDVGAHVTPKNLEHALFIVTYQWWLMAAYGLGKIISKPANAMTRVFSKIAHTPRGGDVYAKMNYPYFYFWRARLLKKYRSSLPTRYRPTKPILFLYGKKKKYNFHSPKWESIVASTPHSQVVGLENCDHWLMVRDPKTTNQVMEQWFKTFNA